MPKQVVVTYVVDSSEEAMDVLNFSVEARFCECIVDQEVHHISNETAISQRDKWQVSGMDI